MKLLFYGDFWRTEVKRLRLASQRDIVYGTTLVSFEEGREVPPTAFTLSYGIVQLSVTRLYLPSLFSFWGWHAKCEAEVPALLSCFPPAARGQKIMLLRGKQPLPALCWTAALALIARRLKSSLWDEAKSRRILGCSAVTESSGPVLGRRCRGCQFGQGWALFRRLKIHIFP